jgi:signal transduction histidine kinase
MIVRNVHLDAASFTDDPDATPGDFLRIAVTDSGTGITAEVAAKAFEPFFTTKMRGAGTGMGPSMVRGFVQQSGGHINLSTTPGQGTTVSL